MNYTPLQVKTSYSILSSLNNIKSLVALAKEYGYTSLAITDDRQHDEQQRTLAEPIPEVHD